MSQPARIEHFINGAVTASTGDRSQDVTNPATGEVSAQVALASVADVNAAVAAASAAARPIDDKRGTKEFRIKIAGVLARRAAKIALDRAMGKN